MEKNNVKAFSLIELLVVMAIIAILAVVASYSYNKYRVNAMFSKLQTQLGTARTWADMVVSDYDQFPSGTCDASDLSSDGLKKCYYDGKEVKEGSGDLMVQAPLKVTFIPDSSDKTCGFIVVTCPADRCGGLKSSSGGNAKICVNTCDVSEVIRSDTNLFGVQNGGCP